MAELGPPVGCADPVVVLGSSRDSVRFALSCLEAAPHGGLEAVSTFVDPDGVPQLWHDFGPLVGPGWAANALGGARILADWAAFAGDAKVGEAAAGLVEGVLAGGYRVGDGPVFGYRNRQTGEYAHNFKGNRDWLTPGSQAKIGLDALAMADRLPEPAGTELLALSGCILDWIDGAVERGERWYPRRVAPDGAPFPRAAEGGDEPIPFGSAEALYIPWLRIQWARRGRSSELERVVSDIEAWFAAGRPYGSINHDVYDRDENVARAVAFRVLVRAGAVCDRPDWTRAAFEDALAGLQRFRMTDDRNGVSTAGLLFMCDSWPTAYLWENGESALAFLEAAAVLAEAGYASEAASLRDWAADVSMAISRFHFGEKGFLTEGVDWSNHIGRQHHVDQVEFGPIRYTQPLLNNLHHVAAAMVWLGRQ